MKTQKIKGLHRRRGLALGALLLLIGAAAQAQAPENDTVRSRAIVTENVYIPKGAVQDHVRITGALDCGSKIGVTKLKSTDAGTTNHVYEDDANYPEVRTVIAKNETASSGHAFTAFLRNVFFDDKDIYSVWCFNYGTGGTAYSLENNYFIETWRNYADAAGFTAGTSSTYEVSTPGGLAYFAKQVNSGEDYSGESIDQTTTINLNGHYWEPIGFRTGGNCDPATDYSFAGSYNGRGHIITNTTSILPAYTMGLFGDVGNNGSVNYVFAIGGNLAYTNNAADGSLGAIVGTATGDINGCEAANVTLESNTATSFVGGIAGTVGANGEVRNSFAVDNTVTGTAIVGGLAGSILSGGQVSNAYTKNNSLTGTTVGHLVGSRAGAIQNAYTDAEDGSIVGTGGGGIYVYSAGASGANNYTATIGADQLGYMYADNTVVVDENKKPMFEALTSRAREMNSYASSYRYVDWARPALAYYVAGSPVTIKRPINDDLPVLLLDNHEIPALYPLDGIEGQELYVPGIGSGGFRTVATYGGPGNVLQYGGPTRDGSGNTPDYSSSENEEIDGALDRATATNCIFIYGDIESPAKHTTINADRISIYEHAAIMNAGVLSTFDKTHVSITFDNSSGANGASATSGINGITNEGQLALPRDWHMLSTPLSNAPLGFNYRVGTTDYNNPSAVGDVSGDSGSGWNNPWTDGADFGFLSGDRFWMTGWTGSQSVTAGGYSTIALTGDNKWTDGYFPSTFDASLTGPFANTCISGTNEEDNYPYGMDFYSWYEPQYHYINFKRNGPNHWHSDGAHLPLVYTPETATNNAGYGANENETFLLSGKGYFASIAEKTLLQSSGYLNGTGGGGGGESIIVRATKVWVDNDDMADARTDAILRILGNGESILGQADQTIAEDATDSERTVSWTVPEKDGDGVDITYTVVEIDYYGDFILENGDIGSNSYAVNYGGNAEDGFTVTNTYTPEEPIFPLMAYRVGILQEVQVFSDVKTKSADCGSKTDPTPILFYSEDEYFSQFDSHQEHTYDDVNYIPDLEVYIPEVVNSSSVGTSEIALNASGLWTNISFTNNEPTISDFGENSVLQVLDVMDDFMQLYGLQSPATSSQAQQAFGAVAFLRNGYLCEYDESGSELALTGNWISSSISFDANPKYRVTTDDGKTIDLYQMKYMDGDDNWNSCTGSTNYGNTYGNLYAGKISSGGEDWDCYYTNTEYDSSPLHLFLVANEPPGKQATAKAEGEPKATIDGVSAGTTAKGGSRSQINIEVTKTENDLHMMEGWNLVGNPFHAYLDFNKLCEANEGVISDDTYVVYNADGFGTEVDEEGEISGQFGDGFSYYVKNGSSNGAYAHRYLHPHQGFFVKTASSTTLNFSESQTQVRKQIGTGGSYRGNERPAYPLVNLFLSSSKGCSDVCVVEFNRPEWGGATKLRDMYSGNGLFYAAHDDGNYAALFATPDVERVPIKFEPKEENGDTYTISWNTANGEFSKLYLVDNLTGVQYDMLRNKSYSFQGKKGDYWSRFYITFGVTDVEENMEDDDAPTGSASTTFAFFNGSDLVVTNTASGSATLDLIDLQGRVLHRATLGDGQSHVSLPDVAKGMYLLRMNNTNGSQVQKIVVR